MLSSDHASFESPFRTVRLGTMRASRTEQSKPLRFTGDCLKFSVRIAHMVGLKVAKINIPSKQLTSMKAFFGRGCPMICFTTTPKCAASIRDQLHMKKGLVPTSFYDPKSKVQAETQIVVVLDYEAAPYSVKINFEKVLSAVCKAKEVEVGDFYSLLSHNQANSILVDISGICDKLGSLSSRGSPKPKLYGILQESSSLQRKDITPSTSKANNSLPSRESAVEHPSTVGTSSNDTSTKEVVPKIKNRARKTVPKANRAGVEAQLLKMKEKTKQIDSEASSDRGNVSDYSYGGINLDFTLKKASTGPYKSKIKKRTKTQKPYRSSHQSLMIGESMNTPFTTISATTQPTHSNEFGETMLTEKSPPNKDNVLEECSCIKKQPDIVLAGNESVKCMAIDAVDSRLSRCIYPVSITMMMRPSKSTPLLALCDEHRERMMRHECCPGCGMFCAGGNYLICVSVAECPHRFHGDCMLSLCDEKCCLHCHGAMSLVREVTIEPKQDSKLQSIIAKLDPNKTEKKKSRHKTAKMGHTPEIVEKTSPGIIKTLGIYTIDTHKLPVGEDREILEDALCNFFESTPEKLKKTIVQITSQGDLPRLIQFVNESEARDLKSAGKVSSVLIKPVICSNIPMVYLLLSTFANVNNVDYKGKTALFYAEEREDVSLINFLIKSGADIMIKDSEGMMCIHQAAKNGRLVSCAALLSHSRDIVNMQDDGGWTPILWATEHKHVTTAKYLEHFGADMMKTDKEGNTCLHWAALSGNIDLIINCLQKCGGINIQNLLGDTALHIATRQDNVECVLCLINWGANLEIENREGKTPLQCAFPNTESEILLKFKDKVIFHMSKAPADPIRESRVVSSDLSRGFENLPVSCINAIDDAPSPTSGQDGFHYVVSNVHTTSETIVKNAASKMQSCYCYNECSNGSCLCGIMGGKCWYNKNGELVDDFDFVEAPFIVECSETCWCPATCHNRVVQKGIKYKLQVHRTATMGWSVRALETIPRGAFVCEYIGELISDAEADNREDDSYLFDLENSEGEIFCIDARFYGNVSRFINHLCDPNLMPIRVFIDHHDKRFPRLAYFSTKEIVSGEELGFDYGDKFWDIKSRSFTCGCGSSHCKYSAEAYRLKKEMANNKSEECDVIVP